MRRILAAAACALFALAAPTRSFALSKPYCSGHDSFAVTCTGGTPKLGSSGWPGLRHPEVVPIFWGSYWNTGTNPSQGQMIGTLQYLLNSPYFAALGQYGTNGEIGLGRMVPAAPINSTVTLPTTATPTNVGALVNSMITAGNVPPPTTGSSMLYIVFLPPSVTQPGYDENFSWYSNEGLLYNVAWVHDDPAGIAHEMAEAIAGNMSVTNCTYDGDGSSANQIADICQCHTEAQQGGTQLVQAYWSQAENACVIPKAWNGLYEYEGVANDWTQIGGEVRQIYAGSSTTGTCATPPCLIATDTNDNLIAYSGTPNVWTSIGGPGAMFSVGQGWIMGVSPDTSSIYRYTSTSGWTWIGGPCSAVYSGAFDLCTEYSGVPALYLPATNTWASVGGPADQLVVGPSWAAALDWNTRYVFLLPPGGNGSSWISTGHPAAELFVGGVQTLAGRDLTATGNVSAMTTSYTNGAYVPNAWQSMGGPGNSFALYGASNAPLVGLTPNRSAVKAETMPIESPPASWSTIGAAAGRLVSGGAKLYATGPVVF